MGAHIQNANTVHPEWQDVRVGDTVWLARRYGDAARQVVAAVAPGSHLVLMSPADFERVQQGSKASGAWGFYLRRKDGWTRLIARGSGGAVGHVTFDMPHFVMEQKMMRGIRDRAEQTRRDQVHAFMRHKYQARSNKYQQSRQIVAENSVAIWPGKWDDNGCDRPGRVGR